MRPHNGPCVYARHEADAPPPSHVLPAVSPGRHPPLAAGGCFFPPFGLAICACPRQCTAITLRLSVSQRDSLSAGPSVRWSKAAAGRSVALARTARPREPASPTAGNRPNVVGAQPLPSGRGGRASPHPAKEFVGIFQGVARRRVIVRCNRPSRCGISEGAAMRGFEDAFASRIDFEKKLIVPIQQREHLDVPVNAHAAEQAACVESSQARQSIQDKGEIFFLDRHGDTVEAQEECWIVCFLIRINPDKQQHARRRWISDTPRAAVTHVHRARASLECPFHSSDACS